MKVYEGVWDILEKPPRSPSLPLPPLRFFPLSAPALPSLCAILEDGGTSCVQLYVTSQNEKTPPRKTKYNTNLVIARPPRGP